ncbi:MAG: DNA internalization-related competence protein ComEC/Rec2 [Heliobacteriaceae bacterium]|nr:DNA internalization-related competence protein ComEC/Rec2 [Heliobacteriaceae bacterium]
MQRPLVVFVCLLGAGIAGGLFHRETIRYPFPGENLTLGLVLLIITVLLFWLGDRRLFALAAKTAVPGTRPKPYRWLLYTAVFICGWYYAFAVSQPYSFLYPQNGQQVTLAGKAEQISREPNRLFLDLCLDNNEKIRVKYYGPYLEALPQLQQRVQVTGQVRIPNLRQNPGEFDYQGYLWRQGIGIELFTDRPEQIRLLPPPAGNMAWLAAITNTAAGLRHKMENFIAQTLPASTAAVINGIVFGGQTNLTAEDRETFRITGVAHAFAVSGANVGIIAASVLFLLNAGRRRSLTGWPGIALTVSVVFFYGLMTGFPPSVQRAVLMTTGGLVAFGLQRRVDPPTLLAAAALPLLLVNPLTLADAGFQLSFGATGGIIYFLPAFQHWWHHRPFARQGRKERLIYLAVGTLAASLAAQLAVGPLIAHYFNLATPAGLLANLGGGIMIGAVTILGFAAIFLLLIWSPAATGLIWAAGWLVEHLVAFLHFLAGLPGAAFTVATPSPLLILTTYIVYILWRESVTGHLSPRFRAYLGHAGLVSGSILFLIFVARPLFIPPPLQVTFVNVGQGDCTLLRMPNGRHVLIDAPGPVLWSGNQSKTLGLTGTSPPVTGWQATTVRPPFDPGEKIVGPLLNRFGITHLDVVVNTHADQDHIGGLLYLLQTFPVDQLVLSPPPKPTKVYQQCKQLATSRQIAIQESPPLKMNLSPDPTVSLEVLHPDPNHPLPAINDTSIVLRLRYGSFTALFTGDIANPAQAALVDQAAKSPGYLRADVVKVPHHGSPTSCDPAFLAAINHPTLAVISVGPNSFGHPSPRVIQAWTTLGTKVLRTDRYGAVTIKTNGYSQQVETVCRDP